ncbi:unknown protein [Simkania negevensis Z]|uniref:Secreted protein n=1 Tax=Simkania negevensis (strain ATCC VR-1471 / DSM 27360 / Z) TaxID=331113 RepID=F8L985_SIMNZ|nr:unknown protein [Simkania negevensis Z]
MKKWISLFVLLKSFLPILGSLAPNHPFQEALFCMRDKYLFKEIY